jgi:hypothetical protein
MSWRGVLWEAIEKTAEARDDVRLRGGKGRARGEQSSARTAMLKAMGAAGRLSKGASLSFAAAASGGKPREGFTISTAQRVVVKAHVAKHGSSAFGGRGGGGAIRAHVQYLEREGRDGPERGEFYDREIDGLDAKSHTRDWGEDRHHLRFIVSPEHGDRLADMRDFVRDMMGGVERDLGCKLDWVAINHYDTDQPHAHVLVRGAHEDGRALFIPKAYMAHGFRVRAQDTARDHLGDLTRDQAEERVRKEMTLDRVTSLDRHLERARDGRGHVHRALTDDRGAAGAVLRGRLAHLEGLGIAERAHGAWRVEPDFIARLNELTQERDILRAIHRGMAAGREAPEALREGQIAGRVVALDTTASARLATVRSAGERDVLVRLGSEQSVSVGDALVVTAGKAQDHAIVNLGDLQAGVQDARLSPVDQLIAWRTREREAGRTPPNFDRESESAIRERELRLIENGLANETPHGVQHTREGWERLRENDIHRAITEQLGRAPGHVREAFTEREGRYLGTVQTQSGLFAVMERGPGLVIGQVSKAPNIAIGNAISFDPAKGLVKDLGQALGRDFGLGLDR